MVAAFRKSSVINEPAFIYIEWERGDKPSENEDVAEVIQDVDLNYFTDGNGIEESLPYLTFNQAEILFKELKKQFGAFTLKKVSLANRDSGSPSIEDEPYISPFDINHNYTDIMRPLMEEVLRDPQFKDNTYDELASYFTNLDSGILTIYGNSLGLSRADLPYFPTEDEVEGAIKHKTTEARSVKQMKGTSHKKVNSEIGSRNSKVVTTLGVMGLIFGLLGTGLGVITQVNNRLQDEKITYLYNQLQEVVDLDESQSAADVFSRYFLTNYFSGNKEKLAPFLDEGDVKYTQPQNATISSMLLEKFIKVDEGYEISYVVVYKQDEVYHNERFTFTITKSEKNSYGWVVISEPVKTEFVSAGS
ncbi:TPA: hypothetical protein ACGOR8_001949 [Streptococcus suis]